MSLAATITGLASLPFLSAYFEKPLMFYLIIPSIILIFLSMISKKAQHDLKPSAKRKQKRLRKFIFSYRLLIFILLIVALATPIIKIEKTVGGENYLKVLIDNSSSMELFDLKNQYELINTLKELVNTEVTVIGQNKRPRLGDDILNNLKPGENILLLTDGNAYYGPELGDVAVQAQKINATLNALELQAKEEDYGISIIGPSRTIADVDTDLTLKVHSAVSQKAVTAGLFIDDKLIFSEKIIGEKTFTYKFEEGSHTIMAKIDENDYFSENNEYFKTLSTVKKPQILIVSQQKTPLEELLEEIYEVKVISSLPADISSYNAIIINDLNADLISTDDINRISEQLMEENGILFVGGKNSFDRGGYKDQQLESILPVFVSSASKKEGEINVVLAIDISGSAGYKYGKGERIDTEKGLAISALRDLGFDNRIGAIAFNHLSYLVADLDYKLNQEDLEEKIASLKTFGGTRVELGLLHSIQMLQNAQGSKNIILISDGVSFFPPMKSAAEDAASKGIKIYPVAIGSELARAHLQELAKITNGIYFTSEEVSSLKLLFGDPEDIQTEASQFSISVLNKAHFITRTLNPTAQITGYNQVVPKDTAQLLVTTSQGAPILTVWRYGLGRVAALSTDDGNFYASQLMNKENSAMIIRTVNWLIGNPMKNEKEYVYTKDTTVGEPTTITIKSRTEPETDLPIYSKGKNIYLAEYTPRKTGIIELFGAKLASNYPQEYKNTGLNSELVQIIEATGGQIYSNNDAEKIAKQVKSKTQRTKIINEKITWPFLLLAALLFLMDITTRRMFRK